MSFSLAVANGDLVQQGGQLAIVSGIPYLKQQMDLWIRERAGIDRFHPKFGSQLQNFIGGIVENDTRVEVIEELTRVLLNLQKVQEQGLKNNPQMYSASELLAQIVNVDARISYDTVTASVLVANAELTPVATKTSSTVGG